MCHGGRVGLVQALAELLIDVLNRITAHIDLVQVFYLAAVEGQGACLGLVVVLRRVVLLLCRRDLLLGAPRSLLVLGTHREAVELDLQLDYRGLVGVRVQLPELRLLPWHGLPVSIDLLARSRVLIGHFDLFLIQDSRLGDRLLTISGSLRVLGLARAACGGSCFGAIH